MNHHYLLANVKTDFLFLLKREINFPFQFSLRHGCEEERVHIVINTTILMYNCVNL